ncbi:MAG: hypothetical protein ACQESE_05375, partial [Nanobdellota archaeon]
MATQNDWMVFGAVVAVLLSLFSLLYSLSIIDSSSPTGLATNNASGEVDISILDRLSISLVNSSIDFGACAINRTQNYSLLDSDLDPDDVDNDDCTGGQFPGYLSI